MRETKVQRAMRLAIEEIAAMPLSKDFEYDRFGEIKPGSSSYGPNYAASHFQRLARAALAVPRHDRGGAA